MSSRVTRAGLVDAQRRYADEKHGYVYRPRVTDRPFQTCDGIAYVESHGTRRRLLPKVRGKAARKADKRARRGVAPAPSVPRDTVPAATSQEPTA